MCFRGEGGPSSEDSSIRRHLDHAGGRLSKSHPMLRELLHRLRRNELRRIQENPAAAFGDELARILVELPAAKREVIARAFSQASLERGQADDGDR